MTNEQLKAIEARLARTDSKRWELEEDYVIHEDGSLITQVHSDYSDADFIANAGKDIPALCAALRESQRQHAECADAWADEHHERTFAELELRRARAVDMERDFQAELSQAWAIAKDNRERRIKAEDTQIALESENERLREFIVHVAEIAEDMYDYDGIYANGETALKLREEYEPARDLIQEVLVGFDVIDDD
jgi:hypothetical protein